MRKEWNKKVVKKMNRFVTFCIGIGIALLVLAVISNTVYAAITTETADSNPTMTEGTISAGGYTDTASDNGATQNLYEEKISGKGRLDCYYNLSTAIDESQVSAFEIGVNAWYSATATDSFTVYVWDDGTNSWDSTTITVTATSDGTTYTDTTTIGIEHIRDSDGNITIRFDDVTPNAGKQNTLYIDYLYVKLTYTPIISCDIGGNEINQFAPGEDVYVKGTGLDASTDYKIWIQDDPVSEGDALVSGEDPSGTLESVTTNGNGNFGPTLIWSIQSGASVTHDEYDIVVNKGISEVDQTYNAADDDIDSAAAVGMVAPVPDVSSLILFASGLVLVSVYFVYGSRREKWKEEL